MRQVFEGGGKPRTTPALCLPPSRMQFAWQCPPDPWALRRPLEGAPDSVPLADQEQLPKHFSGKAKIP